MLSNRLLLLSISEAILMVDRDGYIKYGNPSVATITGYTEQDLLDQPLSIFYNDPEEVIKTDYELGQAKKTGRFISEGWRFKKNGDRFWSEMTISPLLDDANRFNGYSAILRDISDKKKLELELREREERYRLTVEAVRDYAILMLDPKGYIVTWNEGARKTKGYYADEIIGKHFSVFYTSEDLESKKPERELKIAVETGKYEEEGWRVKKNGSVFWANVVITALFNEENKLTGFSKVTRDLTERKYHEDTLMQSEERYRLLVEQVIDYGIFMMDDKGRIISWNEGARRIKGYTAEEIIGKYFSIFYPEEDIILGKPAHELRVARAQGKYEEEGWRIRKDGSRFWANVLITAVYNKQGTLIGFSKVTRDLTERKESEKALKQSHDRYRMIAKELKATNDELSFANQELDQFTSIVSHDLQEPVRTIKSFLQLINIKLDEGQSQELKLYINKAINAADRMRELIRNLLHYSQLSRGEIVKEEISVQSIFEEAVQNLRSAIEATRAEVTIHTEGVDTIHGDRVQLVQLFQNLMSNALKFTESEQPKIRIECRKENDQVKFSVSDNGIGIAETDVDKIFEIFRRLKTRKKYSGTGIGLAICKKIVDRHSGRIWPESYPGKGTTFHVTLNNSNNQKQLANEEV